MQFCTLTECTSLDFEVSSIDLCQRTLSPAIIYLVCAVYDVRCAIYDACKTALRNRYAFSKPICCRKPDAKHAIEIHVVSFGFNPARFVCLHHHSCCLFFVDFFVANSLHFSVIFITTTAQSKRLTFTRTTCSVDICVFTKNRIPSSQGDFLSTVYLEQK